jgi:hypothetical protein
MNTRTPKPLKLDAPAVAIDFIFKADRSKLALVGCELATYLVCSAVASGRRSKCTFELIPQQLAKATGYSLRQTNRAIHKLQDTGHILKIAPYLPIYELGNPFVVGVKQRLADGIAVTLRTLLHFKHRPYLVLPHELFLRLPTMSSVELQASIVLLEMTWFTRSITVKAASWARQANIANTRELHAVVEKMTWCWDIEQVGRNFFIQRTDADIREERLDRAMMREIAKNHASEKETRPYTSETLRQWLTVLGVQGEGGNTDMRIRCPNCEGILPSLSINLELGTYGVLFCHSCGFGKNKITLHLLDILGIPRKISKTRLKEISDRTQAPSSPISL